MLQIINEIFEGEKQGTLESEKSYLTRSLLLDFYEKSEGSEQSSVCSSVLTYQGGEVESKEKMTPSDDDTWSIQVNASTKDEEEDEEEGGLEEEVEEEEEYDDNYDEIEEDGSVVDDLCEAITKINVNEEGHKVMAKFEGKHTRFVYNSDDELEGAEECNVEAASSSPGVLHLKGLPTPKGKHLRFPEQH